MSSVLRQRLNLSDIDNITITFNSSGQIQSSGSPGMSPTITGPDGTITQVGGTYTLANGTGMNIHADTVNNILYFNATGSGLTWNNVVDADSPDTMVSNNGYLANGTSIPIQLVLPTTSSFGDKIEIAGFGSQGWQITQATGQQIIFGNTATTSGASGSLSSSNQHDCVELLCVVANLTWMVVNVQGNIQVT